MLIKRSRAARGLDSERKREVELIHITRANPLVDGGNALREVLFGHTKSGLNLNIDGRFFRPEISAECRESRRIAIKEKSRAMVEAIDLRVNAEPRQWLAIWKREQVGCGLKKGAALISKIPRGMVAGGKCGINFGKKLR